MPTSVRTLAWLFMFTAGVAKFAVGDEIAPNAIVTL
jgi:hypothetical protein